MYEWNINQKYEYEPTSRPASRRISFCPTCGRPFVRGTGVQQGACSTSGSASPAPGSTRQSDDPSCVEYCQEQCLPGILA